MGKLKFEVVSEYGAWAPNPEELNQVLDNVHRVLHEEGADSSIERVREVLARLVPIELQGRLRLVIRPLLSESSFGTMQAQYQSTT